jgi:diguanylate cyclase (GGDEF)-like protein
MNNVKGFGDTFWESNNNSTAQKRDFFDAFKIQDHSVGKLCGLIGASLIFINSIFYARIFSLFALVIGATFIAGILKKDLFALKILPFLLLPLTFMFATIRTTPLSTIATIAVAIIIVSFGYSMTNERIFDQNSHIVSLLVFYPLNTLVLFFTKYSFNDKMVIFMIFAGGAAASRISALFIAPLSKSLLASNKRAQMLNKIAQNSRNIQERDPHEVANSVLEIIMNLGARSAYFVSGDRRFKNVQLGDSIENVEDIAKRCVENGKTMNIYSAYGSNNAIYAIPVRVGARYACAIVTKLVRVPVYESSLLESYEILANQAGRALDNANLTAEDRRLVEQLKDESLTDELSGLGNRRFAEQAMTQLSVGDVVVMIDLDGLKVANDTYGHAAGDEVIKNVGIFLSQNIRNPDVATRIGGDEFLLILKAAENGADSFLERIRSAWESYHIYDTSFSLGYAIHPVGSTPQATLQKADSGLYKSKEDGKNKVTKVP